MPEENSFLSIPEAAAKLGITRIAVFKKVKKGRIAAIKIGRNWAIPASALETAAADKTTFTVRARDAAASRIEAIKSPPPARPEERGGLEDMGWD